MLARSFVALLSLVLAPPPQLPPEAAAVVNGVTIPRKALLDVVQSVIAQLDDVPDTATTEQYRRRALDSLIDFELLYQEGMARQLAVPDSEIADEIKRTEKSFKTPKQYQAALEAKGLTRKDVEVETRRALVVRRVLEDVVWPGAGGGEAAIQKYYDDHKDEFRHPDQVRSSYILVRVKPKATPAEKKAARQEAENLAKRASAGEDFAALAKAESDDPATSQLGGDLGYVSAGTMDEAFEKVVLVMQPGQVSPVIETKAGFVIAKVSARRPSGVASLAEVRDRIAAGVREQGRQKAQDDFVAGLRGKAKIDVAPDLR